MSVVGTIIVCAPDVKGCPGTGGVAVVGQNDVVMMERDALIGLRQLVKGRMDESEIKRWHCTEKTHCYDPKVQTVTNYVGLEEKLRKALLGETGAMGQGIIGRHALNLPMAPGESGIITAGGDYVAIALRLANESEHNARSYIEHFSTIMAAEMAYKVIDQALMNVLAATAQYEGGSAVDAQKKIREARLKLGLDFQAMQSENLVNTGKFDYFMALVNAAPRMQYPTIVVPNQR